MLLRDAAIKKYRINTCIHLQQYSIIDYNAIRVVKYEPGLEIHHFKQKVKSKLNDHSKVRTIAYADRQSCNIFSIEQLLQSCDSMYIFKFFRYLTNFTGLLYRCQSDW